jgi:hypothetical protein
MSGSGERFVGADSTSGNSFSASSITNKVPLQVLTNARWSDDGGGASLSTTSGWWSGKFLTRAQELKPHCFVGCNFYSSKTNTVFGYP